MHIQLFTVFSSLLSQLKFDALVQKINETIPFKDPERVRDLFAYNFTAFTTMYRNEQFEHDWDSFKKFMRIFNGRYRLLSDSQECSNGRGNANVTSQTTLEMLRTFEIKYQDYPEQDLWSFKFDLVLENSEKWKIQRLFINPVNQISKFRAETAIMRKTELQVQRIAKKTFRKIYFDPEWSKYLEEVKIDKYIHVWYPKQNSSLHLKNFENIKPVLQMNTTSYLWSEPDYENGIQFYVDLTSDDNGHVFTIPIRLYCIYIPKYDNYYIKNIIIEAMKET